MPANIVRTIAPPDPKAPVVVTLTKEEIDALLGACERSKTWKNRQVTANERPTADRDRAIILLLLDTGLRASELCGVKFGDVNMTTNSIKVLGKGAEGAPGLLRQADIEGALEAADPAPEGFQVRRPGLHRGDGGRSAADDARRAAPAARPASANAPGWQMSIPTDSGIRLPSPTCATKATCSHLQDLLGHSDMAMVKRYARIAQTDCAKAHQKASPVDNWRL